MAGWRAPARADRPDPRDRRARASARRTRCVGRARGERIERPAPRRNRRPRRGHSPNGDRRAVDRGATRCDACPPRRGCRRAISPVAGRALARRDPQPCRHRGREPERDRRRSVRPRGPRPRPIQRGSAHRPGGGRGGTIAPMTDRPPITLRSAAASDAERIAALFTDEGYPSGPSDIVDRLRRFGSAESRVVVAEHEGEVLGFIAVHAIPRFEHTDRVLRIMALVVDAGVRERGVGRLLMDEAERIGTELEAAFVEVTAGHHRPDAYRLYEELGYDGSVAAYLRKRV